MEERNPELEIFRQEWKAEVSARARPEASTALPAPSTSAKTLRRPSTTKKLTSRSKAPALSEDEDVEVTQPRRVLDELIDPVTRAAGSSRTKTGSREPRSALEHYEKAVEREAQGSLGDSVALYRKAFRLDDRVDQKYKNKHFPSSSSSKPSNQDPSNASVTVPNPAHHSLNGPPQTINDLVAGFSGLSIEPAPPIIDGDIVLPCPMARIPDEILVHVFLDLAIMDIAAFARLAQVCKRMAYLVVTEEQIWKRVCLGSEFGFGGMHYKFRREVRGEPLFELEEEKEDQGRPALSQDAITESLLRTAYKSSWQQMFRFRPRIRFNGCYISTINYVRPGQASASQVSWNSPVHIVTYFRYLRFSRDGTVISLQTTVEPIDVVHHLTKELLTTHRDKSSSHLPSSVMQNALRGRWRLSTASDNPDVDIKDAEGDVIVETEGVGPKYVYRLFLSLRSAGRGARNNKLVWKGFWNYNLTTDEDDEFPLRKDDRAFFFSRVKSYGIGV